MARCWRPSAAVSPEDRWDLPALRRQLASGLSGCSLELVECIASTNSELMHGLRLGRQEKRLLIAEHQTAGRGRLGRQWIDGPAKDNDAGGGDLLFSICLPLDSPHWSGLSLCVGVALANSLHVDVQLKWPNDLWLGGRKLAGILIETTSVGVSRHVVLGVGINVAARAAAGWDTAPAWAQEVLPGIAAPGLLQRVLPALLLALQQFSAFGLQPFLPGFAARDLLRDRSVLLSDGTTGIARGVDGDGALLVHTALGTKTITSSEVSVRPVATGGEG